MKNDEFLLSKLIEETCQQEDEGNTSSIKSFVDYFEMKSNYHEHRSLSDFVEAEGLSHYELSLIPAIHCFRLIDGAFILDLPKNFSIFTHLVNGAIEFLNAETDEDLLCSVLSEVFGKCDGICGLYDGEKYFLILSKNEFSHEQVDWLRSYQGKHFEKNQSAA